ncbi:MAG: acyl-CoA dehydrogenase [Burkholderiaceae bacterium]|nr:hypothetical protein [Sulfuritalea sp.]MCF8174498.1 acyl-CoA dehydrogenase [Burkholderiaceae bacterium]MCF8183456.1 acyl-CoA dehydrogenase [Polynucleobacter sp.]
MTKIDLDYLRSWVGKSHADEDLIMARHARLMAATLNSTPPQRIEDGMSLPPLWHWIYFLDGLPAHELGPDGHPARGGFLPPVPLPNRMWAGGRVSFVDPVRIGSVIRKESRVLRVDHKTGRSGDLVFVAVLHELKSLQGSVLIREEHDIVYRAAPPPGKPARVPASLPMGQFTRAFTPSSTTLFRYSALTFNGHRIHYDADYCRAVEGYENLVIHGPLMATVLADYAEEVSQRRIRQFDYRAVAPALLGGPVTLHASMQEERVVLYATKGADTVCMQAEAALG